MNATPEAWRSVISIALIHPSRSAVLMEESGDFNGLPKLTLPSKNWLKIEKHLVSEISQSLGVKVSPLYLLDYHCDPEKRIERLLVVCEALEGHAALDRGKSAWWGSDRVELGDLKEESQRGFLRALFKELDGGVIPINRPEWGRSGWRFEAEAWIQCCFEDLPGAIESIETLSVWNVSCLLKIRVSERDYYFKASPNFPCFVNEGRVMNGLAALAPEVVPNPLFVHDTKNWMILEDLGDPLESNDPEMLAIILSAMGRVQIQAVQQMPALKSLKLPTSNLPDLLVEIKEMIDCEEARDGLTATEQQKLRAALPTIEGMVEELQAYSLPLSLNHGDLHGGNVIIREEQLIIFDWTWASITHPFFDLILLYLRNKATWAQYAPEYFKQWSEYESLERCFEAWKLAYPLGLLRMASRYRGFVTSLEKATLNGFPKPVAHFLRHFLKVIERED